MKYRLISDKHNKSITTSTIRGFGTSPDVIALYIGVEFGADRIVALESPPRLMFQLGDVHFGGPIKVRN